MRLDGFDAISIEPDTGSFGAIPAGDYVAEIIESEQVANKNNTGSHLKLTFKIIDGEYENRRLWHRVNYWHNDPGCALKARQHFKKICKFAGNPDINDASEIHGLPIVIRVVQVPRRDTGEMVNEIKWFMPFQAQPQPVQANPKPVAGHRPFGGPMGAVSKPGVATKTAWNRKPNPPTDLTPPADMPF